MKPENFVYWLQGMLEDGERKTLNETQVKMIRAHLALVFMNVTESSEPVSEPGPQDVIPIQLQDDFFKRVQREMYKRATQGDSVFSPFRPTLIC